jgi:DNA-binding NarL/FixJ family response regulator
MIKVAIVEDNKTTREGLETIINLSAACRCVCTCATAEEALRMLPQHKPEVVLMDIQLPNMSGVECVAQLKELLPSVQVIMVTVYEDPDRIFRALRAGACGYLLKRSAPDQVLNAIRDVQQGGVPMSAEIARKVIAHFQKQESAAAEMEKLSAREREVLDLVVHGFTNKEIAERLSVTVEAVRWHLKHIYQKLHVHSRTEAALKFRSTGK